MNTENSPKGNNPIVNLLSEEKRIKYDRHPINIQDIL